MSASKQKTARKVIGRIARHKNVRYHNDAYLFQSSETKLCLSCERPFSNRKKWSSRGQWQTVLYCSKSCQKKGAPSN